MNSYSHTLVPDDFVGVSRPGQFRRWFAAGFVATCIHVLLIAGLVAWMAWRDADAPERRFAGLSIALLPPAPEPSAADVERRSVQQPATPTEPQGKKVAKKPSPAEIPAKAIVKRAKAIEVLPEPEVTKQAPAALQPELEQPKFAEPAATSSLQPTQQAPSGANAEQALAPGPESVEGEWPVAPPAADDIYLAEVAAWLQRYKRYPRRAIQRGQEGIVRLGFVTNRNGEILSHEIVESSGHRLLDESARKMLRRASPLPPMPARMTQQQLELVIPVAFQLD